MPLLTLSVNIKANLLDDKEINGEKYLLIINEPLNELPKSLYDQLRSAVFYELLSL